MERNQTPEKDQATWRIMAPLALSVLLASLGTSIANIALPTFTVAFSAPFFQVQGIVVAYLAALTASTIFAGRLGDIYGLRRTYLSGLALFSVASLLCGLAPNLWLLIAARMLQGVGAAFLMTLAMALMREIASKDRMGRAMGLLGTVSALGTALGPSLGGGLLPVAGWRAIFLVQVPFALLTLVLAFTSMPRSVGGRNITPEPLRAALDGGIFPNLLVNVLVAAVMMTTLVVGPFYLNIGAGLSEALVGLVMSVGPAIAIFSGVPAGRAVDLWGARRVLGAGLALLTAGALLLAFLPNLVGVGGYVLAIVVLTPGYQLFQAANNTAALADVPAHRRGLVSGLLNLSRNIGLITGASAMGAVFAFAVGTGDLAQASALAIADGMSLTFVVAAGMMALAIVIAFWKALGRTLQAVD